METKPENQNFIKVTTEYEGQTLASFLRGKGFDIPSPCGGRQICGKCGVTLRNGERVLACKTLATDGLEVCTDDLRLINRKIDDNNTYHPKRCGLALDIGTTTLAFALVDLDTGVVFRKMSCLNHQSEFGFDVISRISNSKEHLMDMQKCLIDVIKQQIKDYLPLEKMCVVGNPTMLSIFAGVSPEPMGTFPFTPAFIKPTIITIDELGTFPIYLLSGASAFVGSDILAGVYITEMTKSKTPVLLLDLGTNGEMALYSPKDNKLFVTSTAAGPALEGANISCGVGGTAGGICHFTCQNGVLSFETIEDAKVCGICGSGLLDLISYLISNHTIDESGAMKDEYFTIVGNHISHGGTMLERTSKLRLLRKDVRELQLAKSAIRAGIETLLEHAQITEDEICSVYLAGGLGYYISIESATKIGLISNNLASKTTAIGNSALDGAVRALVQSDNLSEISSISETINLNSEPGFGDKFMKYMTF